jgi:hypothetical protein
MKIIGTDGMSDDELKTELDNGATFVVYFYTISILVMTFKRPSSIYFIRGGHSRAAKGLPFTLVSLLFGWWGIPWGPIYTIGSIFGNLSGKDVTKEVFNALRRPAAAR